MKKLASLVLLVVGCASVPKEVVELSYLVGEDLHQIHVSHRDLAKSHFQNLRRQTQDFLETRWRPVYLEEFIREGGLLEKVRGSNPNDVLEDVQLWAEVAIEEIEKKKKELVDSIDEDERILLGYIDDSFLKVIRANAVITAHLNSLRDIQEVQDQILESLKLTDVRDKINKGLVEASNKSEKAIKDLESNLKKLRKSE